MSLSRSFGAAAAAAKTPAHQRRVTLDGLRVEDLQRIASVLHVRYPQGKLPDRLPPDAAASDPIAKQTYEYRRVDSTHYVLCAVFATNETPDRGQVYPPAAQWVDRDWRHGFGRACYELDVTASPPAPPRPVPS